MRSSLTLRRPFAASLVLALGIAAASCGATPPSMGREGKQQDAIEWANPVYYFEIPVSDMDRAVRFYEAVLGYRLERRTIDGYQMALFPRADGKPGASGALAKGDVYVPSKTGAIIYFDVPDIDAVLRRAEAQGAAVLYPKKLVAGAGYVAEIEDSEGNRLALTGSVE